MSSKRQKQKNKSNVPQKDGQSENMPQIVPTASIITIRLPAHLVNISIDMALFKHYIKAKIIQKKKVSIKEPICLTVFGREEVLYIQVKALVNDKNEIQSGKQGNENDVYMVNVHCEIQFAENQTQKIQHEAQNTKYYGDSAEYDSFKRLVWQNFKLREQLFKVKLGTIRGIIIGGPTGTGKSTFIRRLQKDLENQQVQKGEKVFFYGISATQLLSRVVGGSQQFVRKTFKLLAEHKYSIFVIEDMHLLFGEKQLSSHQTTLAALFSEIDVFRRALIVIGTYNSERDLSSVVFQSGRFEKQITLNLPNHHQRIQILNSMIGDLNLTNKITQDEIKQFNLRLNGYSLGEIKQILRDAYILKGNQVTKQILFDLLRQHRPSQIKELIVEVPEVYWSGIGGYQSVKHEIRKVTELPLKYPHKFQQLGIQPSKGVLLYGPPGCSKTMMAKAIATESKLNFIGIKGPQLYSKYVGQSERAIRNVFRKARAFSPCIIFFDEIDALATQRNEQNDVTNRLLGQLLTEMDGVEGLKQVIIIAATNRPEILDEALTRPGRFDHLIYVGPPDLQARKQIFRICLKKTPLDKSLEQVCESMGQRTDNYTGAEITLVCREAALSALEENIENPIVKQSNLSGALEKVKSRLTVQSIARYENFRSKINGEDKQMGKLANNFSNLSIGNNGSTSPFKF